MGKIFIIISIVVSLATACIGYMNRNSLIKTKDELGSTKSSLEDTNKNLTAEKKKVADSETKFAELTTVKEGIDSDLSKAKSDLSSTKSNLESVTKQLTEKNAEITKQLDEISAKSSEIDKLKAEIATAAAAAAAAPAAATEKETRITELETLNKQLAADLDSAHAKLETEIKKQKEKESVGTRKNLVGRILAVNQAWNFVVLNLGDKSGVQTNAEMIVKRGSTNIGIVRVTTLEPSTSIAEIIPSSMTRGLSIQPGDEVIFKPSEE
jgi:D-alanyl-D-alanine dipeptidase